MSSIFKGSPYRQPNDVEAGSSRSAHSDDEDHEFSAVPLDITSTENAPIDRLRRWRRLEMASQSSSSRRSLSMELQGLYPRHDIFVLFFQSFAFFFHYFNFPVDMKLKAILQLLLMPILAPGSWRGEIAVNRAFLYLCTSLHGPSGYLMQQLFSPCSMFFHSHVYGASYLNKLGLVSSKFIADAAKSGVAQETLQNAARRAGKVMTEQEARQILGVSEETAWEEIMKASIFKYDILFEKNAKNGSFYIQSKDHRAKECLEAVYRGKGEGTPPS
ncbi:hypothetical protein CRYUN_Cryun02cG0117000 [Craigia yunnanensis]